MGRVRGIIGFFSGELMSFEAFQQNGLEMLIHGAGMMKTPFKMSSGL